MLIYELSAAVLPTVGESMGVKNNPLVMTLKIILPYWPDRERVAAEKTCSPLGII